MSAFKKNALLASLAVTFSLSNALADSVSIPHNFEPDTDAIAGQVNDNFKALAEIVNGNANSLDASDGDPTEVVFVDENGKVVINTELGTINAGTPAARGPGWSIVGIDFGRRDIVGWRRGWYLGARLDSSGPAPTTLVVCDNNNVGIGVGVDQNECPANILTIVQNSATDPVADDWTKYSSREYKQGQ
jgi:hypothetical protein